MQIISEWVGTIKGLHYVCHILPRGVASSHTYMNTLARKLPFFLFFPPKDAAGVCLFCPIDWWSRHSGVSETVRSRSRLWTASHSACTHCMHTHTHLLSVCRFLCPSQQTLHSLEAITHVYTSGGSWETWPTQQRWHTVIAHKFTISHTHTHTVGMN